jgi:glycine/D-amino acid oxidase-like deaminating enzyme
MRAGARLTQYAVQAGRPWTHDAEIAVIGRGLMGTACARHLAEAGPGRGADRPGRARRPGAA